MLIKLTAARINPFLSHCGDFTDALTQQKRRILAKKKNKNRAEGRRNQRDEVFCRQHGVQQSGESSLQRHAWGLVPLQSNFSDPNVFCLISQYKHLLLTQVLVRLLEQYYHNTLLIKVAATCLPLLHLVKRCV